MLTSARFRSSTSRAAILAGACLLAIAPFFCWGIPSGHDFEFHMYSWMEVLSQWREGIIYPRWASLAHWGYGEARFLFYPPASWTLGAALGAILPWKVVPGAYCWIVLTLAGGSMYRLAREWLPPRDACFAAVFYAVNPYHLLIVYWRSAFAELLAAVLLPLMVLAFWRLREPGARPVLRLSMVLAAAWLTNVPAAVMVQYSAAGLAVMIAALAAREDRGGERSVGASGRILLRTAMALLLGASLAAIYLVPAIYEQRWIAVDQVMSPGVRPQDNFLFTTLADPDHNRFNQLVSAIALAEIGVLLGAIWFARRKNNEAPAASTKFSSASRRADRKVLPTGQASWLMFSVWGVCSASFMFSLSNTIWVHLPKFRFVQLPFRWLLCMNAALALLLSMAAKRWISRGIVCICLLGTVILAGYRLQPPWWDTAADIREMSHAIADGSGYEGTDEYVPARADAYELNKALPRVSDGAGAPIPATILTWGPTEKHFRIHAEAHQNVTLRLFNYPAWDVAVNGMQEKTSTTEVIGLMVIPLAAGENDVRVYFGRTEDRIVGAGITILSLMVVIFFWMRTQ